MNAATVTIPLHEYEKMKERAESLACIVFEFGYYSERKNFYNNDNIGEINEELIDMIEKMSMKANNAKRENEESYRLYREEVFARRDLEDLSVWEFIKMKFNRRNKHGNFKTNL